MNFKTAIIKDVANELNRMVEKVNRSFSGYLEEYEKVSGPIKAIASECHPIPGLRYTAGTAILIVLRQSLQPLSLIVAVLLQPY